MSKKCPISPALFVSGVRALSYGAVLLSRLFLENARVSVPPSPPFPTPSLPEGVTKASS